MLSPFSEVVSSGLVPYDNGSRLFAGELVSFSFSSESCESGELTVTTAIAGTVVMFEDCIGF